MLFIDGDHTLDGVKNDYVRYSKYVKKGGYIIFDDYLDKTYSPEVKKAVDFIVNNYDLSNYEIIGSIDNIQIAKSFNMKTKSNEFILYKL